MKLTFKPADDPGPEGPENTLILALANSIEFEGELKLRLQACASHTNGWRLPPSLYVGMFAGATKPKPFQRKRPNLSHLPPGKLPPLPDMRAMAVDLHRGSYQPCAAGHSRRFQVALQHIYEGCNTFPLLNVRGASSISNQYRSDSVLLVTEEALIFKPNGRDGGAKVEFAYDDVVDWNAVDNDRYRSNDSGIEIISASGESVFFGVPFIRDAKHSLEYFWNRHKVSSGGGSSSVKLGSTHGRPIVTIATLSGDLPPPPEVELFKGQTEVTDQDGLAVRPGGKLAPRRGSMVSSGAAKDLKVVPLENRAVKGHWHRVVVHQGWLLKQGGVGVGSIKSWIKRYFVLYKTAQGHFLVYYSDFTECPLYTSEKHHRNYVDLAKCTFIRPGSNKQSNPETPPHSFDIVTIEREWTLCAESQENAQRWLQILNRAVDEDVAILPDEELVFKVKPKVDPLGILPATDYSTSLKVSSYGVSVCTPVPGSKDGSEKEHFFWVYTDFYKWSLLSQDKKLALLVNVFADSSFSRRNEYIFRNKEAPRLATAIEFFIEKFMSLMHIRLETVEGAFDAVAANGDAGSSGSGGGAERGDDVTAAAAAAAAAGATRGLHEISAEDMQGHADEVDEIDLLGLDMGGEEDNATVSVAVPAEAEAVPTAVAMPLDPFASSAAAATDRFVHAEASSSANANESFAADPFGADVFNDSPFPSAAESKVAPPLTPAQIQQHADWRFEVLSSQAGAFYDDGSLQIAVKVEVRGSQARLVFSYSNKSSAPLTNLKPAVADPSGLLRFELRGLGSSIAAAASSTQELLMECMKPAFPGPSFTLSYADPLRGQRDVTVELPVLLCSFNEPLNLPPQDFSSRWNQLNGANLESQEVLKASRPVTPPLMKSILYQVIDSHGELKKK